MEDNFVYKEKVNSSASYTQSIAAARGTIVDRNGEVLDEPYIDPMRDNCMDSSHDDRCTHPVSATFPYTVKEGEVFVLGDNRDNSTDSRQLGAIEEKYLLGKMLLRIWPKMGVVK